ncbi:MAG: hypothetical protein ABR929_00435 [Roseiarcus sp.]|jgi:hypothetical protein
MNVYVDPRRSGGAADGQGAEGEAMRAPLAPLLAGARARGVADGLELIGAAAALLDEEGEVLHLNERATRLMGDGLYLCGHRLRARDRAADEMLAAAIGTTLRHGVASRVAVGESPGEGDFGVRIVPVASEGDEPFQLLRAVAILEPPGEAPFAADAERWN